MSRSGYIDDVDDDWTMIRWRGTVHRAINGKRGQAFLREMLAALDAMTDKRLLANELEVAGLVCALGAVGRQRAIDMKKLDPENSEKVAIVFGIADAMAREITWINDEAGPSNETMEARFERVREWIVGNLKSESA